MDKSLLELFKEIETTFNFPDIPEPIDIDDLIDKRIKLIEHYTKI